MSLVSITVRSDTYLLLLYVIYLSISIDTRLYPIVTVFANTDNILS